MGNENRVGNPWEIIKFTVRKMVEIKYLWGFPKGSFKTSEWLKPCRTYYFASFFDAQQIKILYNKDMQYRYIHEKHMRKRAFQGGI